MSPIPTLSSLSATTITLYLAISVAHHTSSPAQEAGPTRPARPAQGRLSQHRPGTPLTAPPSSPGAVANLARPTRPTQGRLSQHRPGTASSLASPELAPSEAAAAITAGAAEAAGAGRGGAVADRAAGLPHHRAGYRLEAIV